MENGMQRFLNRCEHALRRMTGEDYHDHRVELAEKFPTGLPL